MNEGFVVFIGVLITGLAGYIFKSLTVTGAIAAIITGLTVYLGFGIRGLILLGVFFTSSSLWSKYKSAAKRVIEEKLAKGATRDWRQVFANGGAAAFFSVIYYFHEDIIYLIGFVVCLASANSDTWASEIGSLSRKQPIYIRTFKRIEKGTSGAVSLLGSTAALAGSLLIAIFSYWLFQLSFVLVLLIFLCGYLGNVIDTLVGAFYQQVNKCIECGLETEKKEHCNKQTIRIKGSTIVDNDMVNFLSGVVAAVIAMVVVQLTR
ncbi:uncharacterized protein (TIGR00297 family) [Bacillus sp. SORGH_AS 510]|uniref:DUF92 domain-containing protein n=1 Tax=Bacillus sp. SORGH_AS_0510 TaxID=3041771 RepID=UPI002781746E|nr:DUF92 domain-containing protein [Bacillus sp. SORGH_AS_0510]MDQ1145047.1 uncharacterized protein (TIGR00297 family) [Bacillus sp. SORGH_AS_0510]